jgi:hypothetical protein
LARIGVFLRHLGQAVAMIEPSVPAGELRPVTAPAANNYLRPSTIRLRRAWGSPAYPQIPATEEKPSAASFIRAGIQPLPIT